MNSLMHHQAEFAYRTTIFWFFFGSDGFKLHFFIVCLILFLYLMQASGVLLLFSFLLALPILVWSEVSSSLMSRVLVPVLSRNLRYRCFYFIRQFTIWSEWRLTVIAATVRIALVDILDLSEVDIPAGEFLYPAMGWG